jgi:CheY-like chemotaxis protein
VKILIVDDSKAMLEIVRRALEKFDYRRLSIRKVDNPIEALAMIEYWQPEIILTDWHMPRMTGLELIEEVTKLNLDIKVGMITTVDNQQEINKAKKAGACFVLSKPFGDIELHRLLLPLVQGAEESHIVPDSTTAMPEGLALPQLPQLKKLLVKSISPNVQINKIRSQSFDESKVPCLMAIYEDGETQKPRSVALLDLYAICVFAKSNPEFSDELLKQVIFNKKINKEILDTCQHVLESAALAFLDKRSRKNLRLKNISFIPNTFDKLERFFEVSDQKRIDFSCQLDDLAQGKVTLVGF